MRSLPIFPILLVCYEICAYLSNDMYLPALPEMATHLGITQHAAQLTLTTWFIGSASLQLLLGPISDRFGRRPVLFIGGILYVIATIACAISTDLSMLLIARFIEGCCVCSVIVAGYATVHELYDQLTAIQILALMGSIIVLAPAFGPLLGSVVLLIGSWRMIFWFIAIITAIVLLLLYQYMPETRPQHTQTRLDFKNSCADYYEIITNPGFMSNALTYCFLFAGMIGWISMGSFLTIDSFGFSPLIFACFQALIFSSVILNARLVKYVIAWWGPTKLILLGLSIALSGAILVFISALFFPAYFVIFVLMQTLFTSGTAFALGGLNRLAIDSSPSPMGARMAVFSSLLTWTAALVTIVSSATYNGMTLALAKIVLIATLLAFLAGSGLSLSYQKYPFWFGVRK